MMDDREERDEGPLDDVLLEAAARYHEAPAAVPREAMWARIEAARRAPRLSLAGDEPPARRPDVIPLPMPRRAGRRWMRPAAGAAALAAALLVGVLIGRSSREVPGGGATPTAIGAGTSVAEATPGTDSIGPAPAGTSGRGVGVQSAGTRTPRDVPSAVARVEPGTRRGENPEPLRDDGRGVADDVRVAASVPYRLAAVQHMSRAEALLTTFRAGARSGDVDAAVQPWARDLLSSTRLLLDSPAADDPALRALLGDLELVLAQIVQLPVQRGAADAQLEVQLIDRQLDADGVITRLRTAVPAGPARGA